MTRPTNDLTNCLLVCVNMMSGVRSSFNQSRAAVVQLDQDSQDLCNPRKVSPLIARRVAIETENKRDGKLVDNETGVCTAQNGQMTVNETCRVLQRSPCCISVLRRNGFTRALGELGRTECNQYGDKRVAVKRGRATRRWPLTKATRWRVVRCRRSGDWTFTLGDAAKAEVGVILALGLLVC